jgi:hypothetical protein
MTVALILFYSIIAIAFGWYMGREVYRKGTRDGIRPGNAPYAIFVMVLYGIMWPFFLFMGLVLLLCVGTKPAINWCAERMWGK